MNVLRGPEYPTRRIAVRATFLVLLGLSSLFGIMCGLMVVYSIDLPQMDDLARYHPNTTTPAPVKKTGVQVDEQLTKALDLLKSKAA